LGEIVSTEVNFSGKVAFVTGASSGLGSRFAKVLADAGAQGVLAARRTERLKELRAEIEASGGAAHVVQLDVTDYASIKSALAHAETEAGHLRVLSQIGVYCMSKAGAVQMTKAMALEWGRYGINVNAICPGYIETEINREYFHSEGGQKLIDMLPRKRVGRPEDLDGLLLLLASDESRFINGAIMTADDGMAAF